LLLTNIKVLARLARGGAQAAGKLSSSGV
jgi:hypothetical protein